MTRGIYPRTRTTSWPIGELMRNARAAADLTQKAVARKLYVTPHTVREWECGRRHPSITMLDAYLRIVGATITLGGKP